MSKQLFTKEYEDFLITGSEESINSLPSGSIQKEYFLIIRQLLKEDLTPQLEEKIEKGYYYLPTTFYKEVVGFLIGMLQYDADVRLSADELSKHPFLTKNIRHFERINIKEMEKYIKDNKLEIGIYEDKNLWNMFQKNKHID